MIGRVIGLLVLCLLVGLFLATFGITPESIIYDTANTIRSVWRLLVDLTSWAFPYILLGAVIVVPIMALNLLGRFRRRR